MNVSKIGTIAAVALICALFVSPALAGGYRDYAAEDLALVKAHQESVWTLKGYLMAHQNILEQHLEIQRLLQDGTYTDPIDIPIDATGYYETDLAQGTYRVTLPAWKGLGPDEVHMVVCEGYPAGVVSTDGPFIGHPISHPSDDKKAADVIEIVEAEYGAPEECHQELVSPCHTEYRYPMYFEVTDRFKGKVKCTNHAEHGEGWHYQTHECTEYAGMSEWSDTNPHKQGQQERQVEAVYKTVCTGNMVDVTQQVQAAVDAGHRSIKFVVADIRDADTNEFLQSVPGGDPQVGTVKTVNIEYRLNGMQQTIHTMEYQTITL